MNGIIGDIMSSHRYPAHLWSGGCVNRLQGSIMRILYLPIIEPGAHHDVAEENKLGLYEALTLAGHEVISVDYLAEPPDKLENTLQWVIDNFHPHLMLTQLHGHEPLTVGMMQRLKARSPQMVVINWSGDSWRHGLVGEKYLPLVREFDLQLCAAPDILPEYEALGILARFWQIAYEAPVGELPDMPRYDVVFLGNVISEPRRKMLDMLRSIDDLSVGIYGDWEHADGQNVYNFGAGEVLYRQAKVAIADNVYPEQQNYVSNRPIQILMAGGATLLHQHVPKMDVLLGIEAGEHYIEWKDLDDLRFKLHYWCDQYSSGIQQGIVARGQAYARAHHTYRQRVAQLFDEFWPVVAGVKA